MSPLPLPLLLFLALAASDPARELAEALARRIAVAESAGARVGLVVRSLDTGEVLASHRADSPLAAASNTKLVTTAAALLLLPRDFEFETLFFARGRIEEERLRGDLLVRGGGDPTLFARSRGGDASRIFAPLLEALRGKGIRRIEGDLLLDDGFFDRQFVHPSWPRDQLAQPYAAPVCALPLNDGCVDVRVSPGRPHEAASVSLAPGGAPYVVEGRIQTAPGKGKTLVHLAFAGGGRLRVRGEIAAGSRPYTARVAVPDPLEFFGASLSRALEEGGIALAGSARDATAGERESPGTLLHAARSPLLPVLALVNKKSDNFAAEHLLKTLGARLEGEGSWSAGLAALRRGLSSKGIALEGVAMEDGSGLSRGNRFPPSILAALLEGMWRGERRDDFLGTMAAPGEQGTTLERRLRDDPLPERVRAKSGYLSGVRALSGYARTRGEENLAFSILSNGEGKTGEREGKDLADDLVRILVGFARGGG